MNVTIQSRADQVLEIDLAMTLGKMQQEHRFFACNKEQVDHTLEKLFKLQTACAIDGLPCHARCFEYSETMPLETFPFQVNAPVLTSKGWCGIATSRLELTSFYGSKHRISANLSGDIVVTGFASIIGIYLYEFKGLGEPLQPPLHHPQTR